jgi:tyrosyl-tRNA synthetase
MGMSKINNELLTRGIAAIYPSKEFLQNKIEKGEKLTIYLGIDPTGPTLHLGHAIPIKKLGELQKAGHRVILLMGDFTAMIGDPTDKGSARKQLTYKQVMSNLKSYKKQASKLISFSGKNKALLKFNSKWLGKMKFEDVLSLASQMTVQQMLERGMFEKRMKEGHPIFIHEFLYPLMQAYDSVAMNVDGEIGGNDQTFNMLCGRDMMKTMKGKEKFVITMKLLEDNSGKKMGKTENNMLALSDNPDEMYGKIMSWTDGLILPAFELCTDISLAELEDIENDLKDSKINPRDLKMRLAKEVIKVFYGEKMANIAEDKFVKAFQKKEIPEDVEEFEVKENDLLVDVLLKNKIISSKSDFRRLIEGGAITNLDRDKKVSDNNEKAEKGVYRVGKKRFIKITITE